MLECIPSRFEVIRHVRSKIACARCDKIVQTEAASRPSARGSEVLAFWCMYSYPSTRITVCHEYASWEEGVELCKK